MTTQDTPDIRLMRENAILRHNLESALSLIDEQRHRLNERAAKATATGPQTEEEALDLMEEIVPGDLTRGATRCQMRYDSSVGVYAMTRYSLYASGGGQDGKSLHTGDCESWAACVDKLRAELAKVEVTKS